MNLKQKNTWVVGLTGSILSGKSTALDFFKKNGVFVLSADEIVARLYETPQGQKKIITLFGTTDKQQIAQQLFADTARKTELEKILHPLVLKQACEQIRKNPVPLVVFEVPLLFEAGWDQLTDINIVVVADKKTLPVRLKARKMTLRTYRMRLKHQLPEAEKIKRADIVLFHKNKKELELKIKNLCKAFDLLKQN